LACSDLCQQLDKNVLSAYNQLTATVVTTPDAFRQLDRLPPEVVARMGKLYERLEKWPNVSGAKPLQGRLARRWRLRTGDYRLQFRVEGETVIVEKIGHRDKFYEA
jgi:mRNA-degrading endonuclease RelE of RelBE toxin-antitoxin system